MPDQQPTSPTLDRIAKMRADLQAQQAPQAPAVAPLAPATQEQPAVPTTQPDLQVQTAPATPAPATGPTLRQLTGPLQPGLSPVQKAQITERVQAAQQPPQAPGAGLKQDMQSALGAAGLAPQGLMRPTEQAWAQQAQQTQASVNKRVDDYLKARGYDEPVQLLGDSIDLPATVKKMEASLLTKRAKELNYGDFFQVPPGPDRDRIYREVTEQVANDLRHATTVGRGAIFVDDNADLTNKLVSALPTNMAMSVATLLPRTEATFSPTGAQFRTESPVAPALRMAALPVTVAATQAKAALATDPLAKWQRAQEAAARGDEAQAQEAAGQTPTMSAADHYAEARAMREEAISDAFWATAGINPDKAHDWRDLVAHDPVATQRMVETARTDPMMVQATDQLADDVERVYRLDGLTMTAIRGTLDLAGAGVDFVGPEPITPAIAGLGYAAKVGLRLAGESDDLLRGANALRTAAAKGQDFGQAVGAANDAYKGLGEALQIRVAARTRVTPDVVANVRNLEKSAAEAARRVPVAEQRLAEARGTVQEAARARDLAVAEAEKARAEMEVHAAHAEFAQDNLTRWQDHGAVQMRRAEALQDQALDLKRQARAAEHSLQAADARNAPLFAQVSASNVRLEQAQEAVPKAQEAVKRAAADLADAQRLRAEAMRGTVWKRTGRKVSADATLEEIRASYDEGVRAADWELAKAREVQAQELKEAKDALAKARTRAQEARKAKAGKEVVAREQALVTQAEADLKRLREGHEAAIKSAAEEAEQARKARAQAIIDARAGARERLSGLKTADTAAEWAEEIAFQERLLKDARAQAAKARNDLKAVTAAHQELLATASPAIREQLRMAENIGLLNARAAELEQEASWRALSVADGGRSAEARLTSAEGVLTDAGLMPALNPLDAKSLDEMIQMGRHWGDDILAKHAEAQRRLRGAKDAYQDAQRALHGAKADVAHRADQALKRIVDLTKAQYGRELAVARANAWREEATALADDLERGVQALKRQPKDTSERATNLLDGAVVNTAKDGTQTLDTVAFRAKMEREFTRDGVAWWLRHAGDDAPLWRRALGIDERSKSVPYELPLGDTPFGGHVPDSRVIAMDELQRLRTADELIHNLLGRPDLSDFERVALERIRKAVDGVRVRATAVGGASYAPASDALPGIIHLGDGHYGTVRTAVHELTHAATHEVLLGSLGGEVGAKLRRELESLRLSLPHHAAPNQRYFYGQANVDEFVAEAFSNPIFQQFLREQPAAAPSVWSLKGAKRSLKTVWSRFTHAVAKSLGFDLGEDVFSLTMQRMDELIAITEREAPALHQGAQARRAAMEARLAELRDLPDYPTGDSVEWLRARRERERLQWQLADAVAMDSVRYAAPQHAELSASEALTLQQGQKGLLQGLKRTSTDAGAVAQVEALLALRRDPALSASRFMDMSVNEWGRSINDRWEHWRRTLDPLIAKVGDADKNMEQVARAASHRAALARDELLMLIRLQRTPQGLGGFLMRVKDYGGSSEIIKGLSKYMDSTEAMEVYGRTTIFNRGAETPFQRGKRQILGNPNIMKEERAAAARQAATEQAQSDVAVKAGLTEAEATQEAGDISNRPLLGLSRAWWPSGVAMNDRASAALWGAAVDELRKADTFEGFMEAMRKRTAVISGGPVERVPDKAFSFGARNMTQAAVQADVSDMMAREIGGLFTAEEAADINRVMTSDADRIADPRRAFEGFARMGAPFTQDSLRLGREAGAQQQMMVRMGTSRDGEAVFGLASHARTLDDTLDKVIKETYAHYGAARDPSEGWVLKHYLDAQQWWKSSVTIGLGVSNPRYFMNNLFGNISQIWLTQGFETAARMSFQSLPSNIPLLGPALHRAMGAASEALGDVPILGSRINALYNPNINKLFSGEAGVFRSADGVLYDLDTVRQWAAEDGILTSFMQEEFARLNSRTRGNSFFTRFGYLQDDIFAWANEIEIRQRAGLYCDLLRQGYTRTAARDRTLRALYDWTGALSRWEQNYLTTLVPFYRFIKLGFKQAWYESVGKALIRPGEAAGEAMLGKSGLARMRNQGALLRLPDLADDGDYQTEADKFDAMARYRNLDYLTRRITWTERQDPNELAMYRGTRGQYLPYSTISLPAMTALDMGNLVTLALYAPAAIGVGLTKPDLLAPDASTPFWDEALNMSGPIAAPFVRSLAEMSGVDSPTYQESARMKPGEAAVAQMLGLGVQVGADYQSVRSSGGAALVVRNAPGLLQVGPWLDALALENPQRAALMSDGATMADIGRYFGWAGGQMTGFMRHYPFDPDSKLTQFQRKLGLQLQSVVEEETGPLRDRQADTP